MPLQTSAALEVVGVFESLQGLPVPDIFEVFWVFGMLWVIRVSALSGKVVSGLRNSSNAATAAVTAVV